MGVPHGGSGSRVGGQGAGCWVCAVHAGIRCVHIATVGGMPDITHIQIQLWDAGLNETLQLDSTGSPYRVWYAGYRLYIAAVRGPPSTWGPSGGPAGPLVQNNWIPKGPQIPPKRGHFGPPKPPKMCKNHQKQHQTVDPPNLRAILDPHFDPFWTLFQPILYMLQMVK